ncbi:uncharacterized protein LOC116347246 [Contarinia nasturtii]|uniref:uncharacterized protein LOC116347246 n=1 Tax=Contarinia nasturtii TaxID=265458 RepID=UPI0012D3C0A6|nr:uncharacterized protein LOC116347246 [Contarinia nasturtii]
MLYIYFCLLSIPVVIEAVNISYHHGFVSSPKSRALLCQEHINKNCGDVQYEPQSVEGPKGFPLYGPMDGKIASAGVRRFRQLDEYDTENNSSRWNIQHIKFISTNETHVQQTFTWEFTARHSTTVFKFYLSNQNYTTADLLTRSVLNTNPFCEKDLMGSKPNRTISIPCFIRIDDLIPFTKTAGVILSTWDIADTTNAFYQVIDFIATIA